MLPEITPASSDRSASTAPNDATPIDDMVTNTASDNRANCVNQNFGFLSLSAETRNPLYSFALEDTQPSTSEFGSATLAISTLSHHILLTADNRMHHTSGGDLPSKTQIRGLTQVCHQIRQEFWPLYLADTAPTICFDGLASYVTTLKRSEAVLARSLNMNPSDAELLFQLRKFDRPAYSEGTFEPVLGSVTTSSTAPRKSSYHNALLILLC
ncbi:hypothetical protein BU23DRAFT_572346 [Bimuria novae-zelandiae CBS 107.79]|uniref:Uncharacterized protein n=1 Tax=Bimuria novae-zelandiae CBS 107.79 TaxID=1447943 RepID=A0A6A5UUR8_9PLEO|nr:hypothetical protein BU23DRAFT_572346 [Bimuria novae-zelandiae CBS 107.79]